MSLRHHLNLPDDRAENTVDIWLIRRRLGATDLKNKRLCRYLSLLRDEHSFPPPLPTMIGERLERGIVLRSRWLRHAVEAWMDNFLPPENVAQVDSTAMRAAADDMDAMAGNLSNLRGMRVIRGGKAV